MSGPVHLYDSQSTTTTTLTPYLSLLNIISLAWLAYPILSLLFVAFRLQLSLSSAQNALDNTKENLIASCLAAEKASTSTVSMPRYLALASNQQFADAINGTLDGSRKVFITALTVMEAVINFMIDIYRSTLLCFLELVVRGSLSILISSVQQLSQSVKTIADGLRGSLQQDVSTANSAIITVVNAANKINPFGKITAPTIAVPNLDSLENVTLPDSFQQSLIQLNNTIPSASDIKQKLEAVIDTPFELLKKEINETFLGLFFNSSVFPVPEQNTVAFCNDLDTSAVDDLGKDLIKVFKIGVFLLIGLALILIALNCILCWFRWRCMKKGFERTRQACMTDLTKTPQITLTDRNLMLLAADQQHPVLTRFMTFLSTKFRISLKTHIHTRWFFQYILWTPALACLFIGLFGLLSVELQLFALGPLVDKYKGRSQSTVNNFNNLIASSINNSMYNQSSAYANSINARVDNAQSTVNNGVFGWVNVTTTTINNTINEVYTDVQTAVNLVFGGSILEQPAQDFVRCLIGSKVEAVENVLTFLHDNLQLDLPRVDQNVLVLSPSSVAEATKPISDAAIGSNTGSNQGFLGKVISSYTESLKKERVMFLIFIGLWVLVVLIALIVVLSHSSLCCKKRAKSEKVPVEKKVVRVRPRLNIKFKIPSPPKFNMPSLPSPKIPKLNVPSLPSPPKLNMPSLPSRPKLNLPSLPSPPKVPTFKVPKVAWKNPIKKTTEEKPTEEVKIPAMPAPVPVIPRVPAGRIRMSIGDDVASITSLTPLITRPTNGRKLPFGLDKFQPAPTRKRINSEASMMSPPLVASQFQPFSTSYVVPGSPAMVRSGRATLRRSISAGSTGEWNLKEDHDMTFDNTAIVDHYAADPYASVDANAVTHNTERSITNLFRNTEASGPFMTPFDDEHRVQIKYESGVPRKSMQTRPIGN